MNGDVIERAKDYMTLIQSDAAARIEDWDTVFQLLGSLIAEIELLDQRERHVYEAMVSWREEAIRCRDARLNGPRERYYE